MALKEKGGPSDINFLQVEAEASHESDFYIEMINQNSKALGWKANSCLLSKNFKSEKCKNMRRRGPQAANQNASASQTLASANSAKFFGKRENKKFAKAWEQAKYFHNKYNSADAIPDSELPQNFDLRNISGFDFTGTIRDQGHCGSCYTQAFI